MKQGWRERQARCDKAKALGRANRKLMDLVAFVHMKVDEEHDKPEKQHPGVQCTDGCSHAATGCCSMVVLVEMTEAQFILEREPEAVERALPKLLEHSELLRRELDPAAVAGMFHGDRAANADVAHRYHNMDLPCAFLDADRRCSIYASRPLACRTHFVLSEPWRCSERETDPQHATLDKGTRTSSQAYLLQAVAQEREGAIALAMLPDGIIGAVAQARGLDMTGSVR